MRYKLWDAEAGTFFGTYASEEEAANLVRTLLGSYDADMADDLELIVETAEGQPRHSYSGAALIAYAEDVAANAEPAASRPGKVVALAPRNAGTRATPMAASGRGGRVAGSSARAKDAGRSSKTERARRTPSKHEG